MNNAQQTDTSGGEKTQRILMESGQCGGVRSWHSLSGKQQPPGLQGTDSCEEKSKTNQIHRVLLDWRPVALMMSYNQPKMLGIFKIGAKLQLSTRGLSVVFENIG